MRYRSWEGEKDGDPLSLWLVSYPKSGNTWTKLLLREYMERVGIYHDETNDGRKYWLQSVSPKPLSGLTLEEEIQLRPAAMMHMNWLMGPVRLVKSHWCNARFEDVPFFSNLWVDKVIYIHRDPRAIVPSMADHFGKTWDETLETMRNHTASLGVGNSMRSYLSSWSYHVQGWTSGATGVDTLVTSYERLHDDTEGELRRMVRFCGWEVDEDVVREAVEATQFSKLRAREEEEGFLETSEHQERFFRKGEVDSWKVELPSRVVDQVEADHGKMMKKLGYLE